MKIISKAWNLYSNGKKSF